MKFSEKLILLRKRKGMTQEEFSRAVGVSRQSVYKWESGQSYPEAPKLVLIKQLYGVSIDSLLDESEEMFGSAAETMPLKKERIVYPMQKEPLQEEREKFQTEDTPTLIREEQTKQKEARSQERLVQHSEHDRMHREPQRPMRASVSPHRQDRQEGKKKKKQSSIFDIVTSIFGKRK